MKLLVIRFGDDVDLSTLPFETEVTVTHNATTVTGKVVTATAPMAEPEAELVPHSHPASIGPATEL